VTELNKSLRGYEFWNKTKMLEERRLEITHLKAEEQKKRQ